MVQQIVAQTYINFKYQKEKGNVEKATGERPYGDHIENHTADHAC
jgi:hypothetical protein